ncbi:hypothetical protein L226DRAFT_123143 [Lentinus tigrinus ALCF2SS1-7]|uniref:RING-type domain-containing protein n=1 Tax=Lentinus tigrinus ALCF2SS1-6 TaxID=1328759 RepID=A0A5C2SSQ7_9APHY|nr:hypothetical protein L227DRAFT_582370 [Lentinus tigrinus ALCF2SS1-6]RPD80878.1 hypothetical protein L226DRAFT_123143 [Lentinus tigrinus ALCF2SS1-7]
MSVRKASKGKKRAVEETFSEDEHLSEPSSSTSMKAPRSARAREKQPTTAPAKKPKRAETRNCPVCDEPIPLRLLGKHADLESERLDEIIGCIGSTEVLEEAEPEDGSARTRRSALKARQHLRPGSSTTAEASLEETMKTVRTLKRHRKQRHAKLRELTREDEEGAWWEGRHRGEAVEGDGMVCPVCSKFVPGDVDVVEAHVDSCLAYERLRHEEEEAARGRNGRGSAGIDLDGDGDVDVEGDVTFGVMEGVSFRGTGFDIRNRNDQDVDDDIDVDGEDDALFGAPQFTEQDVLAPPELADAGGVQSDADTEEDVDVNGDAVASSGGSPQREPKKGKTLHDLVAEGKVVRKHIEDAKRTMEEVIGVGDAEKVDLAVKLARRTGDQDALVRALESKVQLLESTKVSSSTSLLCRICLDPYTEPTVSTGCWHTCCRECWLRCLGSTKLCPICKRITGATDLRRVYL